MTAIEILTLQGGVAYVEMTTACDGRRPTITQGAISQTLLTALTGRDQLREGQIIVLAEEQALV